MAKLIIFTRIICVSWGPMLYSFNRSTGKTIGFLNWDARLMLDRAEDAPEGPPEEDVPTEEKKNNSIKEEEKGPSGHVEIVDMTFSKKSRFLITVTTDKCIRLLDTSSERMSVLIKKFVRKQIACCDVAIDKNVLAVASKFGDVEFFDLPALKLCTPHLGHLSIITDLQFTKSGEHVVTCDKDFRVRISCYPNTHIIEGFGLGHRQAVTCVALSKSGTYLVTGSLDGTICVWGMPTGQHLLRIGFKNSGSEEPYSNPNFEDSAINHVIEIPMNSNYEKHSDTEPLAITHLVYNTQADTFAVAINHSSSIILIKFGVDKERNDILKYSAKIEKQLILPGDARSKIYDITFDGDTGDLIVLRDNAEHPCQLYFYYPKDTKQQFGAPTSAPEFIVRINDVLRDVVKDYPLVTPKYKSLAPLWKLRTKRPLSELKDEPDDEASSNKCPRKE